MAAGMGSRYGGIKQIEPVGAHKELIIDYSIYDAMLAGFDKVVFIIRRDIEKDFCESIFNRIRKQINAEYVFQDFDVLPAGYKMPQGRTKPWGTAQAILAARGKLDEPFCVINADDFYGQEAYGKIAAYLRQPFARHNYAMVGYKLKNTITDSGSVNRGVCEVEDGRVTAINETLGIDKYDGRLGFNLDGKFHELRGDADVSMTFFGLTPDILPLVEQKFTQFLGSGDNATSLKAEFQIAQAIGALLDEGKIALKMLSSSDQWLGFTYPADRQFVTGEIQKMTAGGTYPSPLWTREPLKVALPKVEYV